MDIRYKISIFLYHVKKDDIKVDTNNEKYEMALKFIDKILENIGKI